jgi:CcmD family protein
MTARTCVLTALLLTAPLASHANGDVLPYELAPQPLPPLVMPVTRNADPSQEILRLRRFAVAQEPTQKPPDEFVPIDQLPPEEKLPAAPLLVSAYVIVTLALFAYMYSLSRRLGTVKGEIARLESDLKRSGRP